MKKASILGSALRLLGRVPLQTLEASHGIPLPEFAAALPGRLGLYVHVPFCRSLCRFCPYNRVLYDEELAGRYVRAVRLELEMLRPFLSGKELTSLYIGGGTPTLLPEFIEELCKVARDLGVSGEIGVEVLPDDAVSPLLERLRGAGVTAVSIGAQAFDDEVLGYLGRNHDSATADRAVERAMNAGFDCVDVDLVFDPVRFGGDIVLRDAVRLFDMGVHQVSAYPMMRFSYTPVGVHQDHDEPLEKSVLRRMEKMGIERGYTRDSVWTFNRDISNRYTSITREFYLGAGPSGSSYLDGLFAINTFDTATYCDLVEQGRMPAVLKSVHSNLSGAAYYLFWRLYEGRIDRARFRDLFGKSIERAFPWFIGFLVVGGFAVRRGDDYVLTPSGLDMYHTLERWVTYQFIEPSWAACRAAPFPASLKL